MRRRRLLALLPLLLVVACTPSVTSTADSSGLEASLRAQQAELEASALQAVARRTCADLPRRNDLAGLPSAELRCLGTGPDRPVSTGDGRPTVVNLWASWCAPCVREMPLLQRTADRAGPDVRFVGIGTQDEAVSGAALLQATGVRYDQYADPDGLVRNSVRALGLPVTLVFDAQGREVARRLGEIRGTWLDDALRKASSRPGTLTRP